MKLEKIPTHYSISLYDVRSNNDHLQIYCLLKLCYINLFYNRNKLLQLYIDTNNEFIRLVFSYGLDDDYLRRLHYHNFNLMKKEYYQVGLTTIGDMNKPTTWRKDMLYYMITEIRYCIDCLNTKYAVTCNSK